MRLGKVDWVNHSKMPILSVDVQPNGFRYVTGGTDHKVCIWNLLPVISEKYEKIGQKNKNAQEEGKAAHSGDVEMRSNEEVSHEKGTNDPIEDSDGYKDDIRIMESLFESEKKRSQRLLAILDAHANPVNCVRWNSIGTLFASASDDGSVLLWEYVGEQLANVFQKMSMQNMASTGHQKRQFFEESKGGNQQQLGDEEPDQEQYLEEWRNKRSWRSHKGGVIDVAWCPDNIHFASCGTDSQIIIQSINEPSAIKFIDQKANGLCFDPFGKFMASQSSEDRSLIIWRIQDFKNLSKECEHSSYYKQAMSQSLFRRLSWSADGQFISTTAGKVGSHHIAPLIERSSWKQMASLSGHNKTICTSRINPRLFKNPNTSKELNMDTGEYQEVLSCYSVVALASIDSTLSIWKPYMDKPFAVVLDIFKMGVTDLSWGFNGNILLASSNDGHVFSVHFKPGVLGHPITEMEKQIIIEKKYGSTILNDYKKHTKLVCQSLGSLNTATNMPLSQSGKVSANLTGNLLKQSQQETINKNGKKKIVPVMIKQYNESANINPFLNPFQNQMIIDQSAANLKTAQNQKIEASQNLANSKPQQDIIQPQVIKQAHNEELKQDSLLSNENQAPKLPPFSKTFGQTSCDQITTTAKSQIVSSNQQSMIQQQQQPIPNQKTTAPTVMIQPQVQQIQQTTQIVQQSNNLQKLQLEEEKESLIEQSARKGKKSKKRKPDNQQEAISQQQVVGGTQFGQNFAQISRQLQFTGSNQQNIQFVASKENLNQLERIFELTKDIITAIPIEEHQLLNSIKHKEQMQFSLPAQDSFSEELKVIISNVDLNAFNRRAEVKILNQDNVYISQTAIEREFVVLTCVCHSFFILYTNLGQLQIFSTRTTQLIRGGLIQEGICFLECSEESMSFTTLNLKGQLNIYKMKNVDYPSVDTCMLLWSASVIEILRIQSQLAQQLDPNAKVFVRKLKLVRDGGVMVFLTDNTSFEYDINTKMWRQLSNTNELANSLKQADDQKFGNNQNIQRDQQIHSQNDGKISSIIKQLEHQNLEDQLQVLEQDANMINQEEEQRFLQNHQNPYQLETMLRKINGLQESMQIYERLHMKGELLYALRMYTTMIIAVGDFVKLKDLVLDYRLLTTAEEEQSLASNSDQQKQYTLHGLIINQDTALHNLLSLMSDEQNEDSRDHQNPANIINSINDKSRVINLDEKRYFQVCGMDKREIFQKSIMPVLQTQATSDSLLKQYLSKVIQKIAELNSSGQHQQRNYLMGGNQGQNKQRRGSKHHIIQNTNSSNQMLQDQEMLMVQGPQGSNGQQVTYQVIQPSQIGLMLPSISSCLPSYVVDHKNQDMSQIHQQMMLQLNQPSWPYMQISGDQIMQTQVITHPQTLVQAQQLNQHMQQNPKDHQ
ncbi:protein hira [Stylonychia lemnae]|uniref:Protein hira n=1 Tax=Stylonychia lemnae TaxID=5949 RepID=A0A077ZPS3_STYLE|nr:protein hira [Stylonychia lemnae]|eukprot:CDW71962.1 protein hira [Stylonychia lemnae]